MSNLIMINFNKGNINIYNDDAINQYKNWMRPNIIISDGPYGVKGFKGDPPTPQELPEIYEKHIREWSKYSKLNTTLWFWNTEIGWALVHPVLDRLGWEYKCTYIWDKGINHIAGNCNTKTLSHLPKVTEVCVQYVRKAEFKDKEGNLLSMKDWLRYEWKRSGLPLSKTNEACGVKNAASRKYFTNDYHWYMPPSDAFQLIVDYANKNGNAEGYPYFSIDGCTSLSKLEWEQYKANFKCKLGVTNVWQCPTLRGDERLKVNGKSIHLNQKPLELMELIIDISTNENDVVWEPFGGLCSGTIAADRMNRIAFAAEIDNTIYDIAKKRVME
ncbi:TPA: DNA methyltransferase [Clostridium perfringens]